IPLKGIISVLPWDRDQRLTALSVVLPALVWIAIATAVLARRGPALPAALSLVNCLLLLFLGPSAFDGYGSTGRIAIGASAAAVLCFPAVRTALGQRIAIAGVLLWSLPWWLAMGSVAKHVVV